MRAEFDRRRKAVTRGPQPAARRQRGDAEGRLLRFPNISRTGWKAKPLASALLQDAGVATIGGPDFGVHGEGYLRLSYANSLENIERALERMGDFLSRPAARGGGLVTRSFLSLRVTKVIMRPSSLPPPRSPSARWRVPKMRVRRRPPATPPKSAPASLPSA